MSYVVQMPNSLTNPTSLYRVIDFAAWKAYADRENETLPGVSLFTSFEEAEEFKNRMNQQGEGS